ncbi:tetratricopeptide repeat protein [bacterium]|nr:tetratricopeptide repeat protein [bacterium]
MKKQIFVIFFVLISAALFYCEKKKEEESIKMDVLFQPVDVEIPTVPWEKSIAIVPLTEKEDAFEDEVFSVLFNREIIRQLSKSKGLHVVTLPEEDWPELEEMQIAYALKGELEYDEGRVKLTLHMDDLESDSTLWKETYDQDIASLFAVSEHVSGRVTAILEEDYNQIHPIEEGPVSPEISKIYVEAKSHLIKGTREEINIAIEKLKAVLRIDTTFTLGYTSLAESYLKITNDLSDRNPVWLRLAQDASLKAIQLDSTLDEGYLRLGQVYLARGDFMHAEMEFRRAIEINSNTEEAWIGLGKIYAHFGLYQPCLEVYEKTLALNPANASVLLSRALILIGFMRYQEAEEDVRRLLRFYPEDVFFHSFLGLILYYSDNLNGALDELRMGMEANEYRTFSHAVLGMIYARQGRFDDALGEVELEVKPNIGNDGSLATAVAAVYTLLKQNGQAIQWLEKAIDWGYREYPWLVNDPNFKELHSDQRFVTLLARFKGEWEENMRLYIPIQSAS